eukprot:tig00000241_g20951.t1
MRAQPLLVAESAARVQEEGARDAATPAVLQLDVVKLFKRGSSTGRSVAAAASQHSQLLLAMRRAGATCPSARFPARRPAGCLSVIDSRAGATCPPPASSPAASPAASASSTPGYAQGPAPPAPPPASPPAAAFACLPA